MKSLTAALILLAPMCGLAQTPIATTPSADQARVTVTSRGNDIRVVLTNIFAQAKKSLILQTNIEYSLYLSLQDTDFQKAIDVICEQAGLKYDVRDGIYHVYKKKGVTPTPTPVPNPGPTLPPAQSGATGTSTPKTAPAAPANEEPSDSKPNFSNATPESSGGKAGKLSLTVLKRKVTTKLAKAPIGAVLEELGAQAGVKIELGENVPAYRLDAILTHTTLRFALEQVTRAAKLTYTFTNHQTILVDSRA